MQIVKFNNLDLEVLEYQDTWALSDRQVAQGFGVEKDAIRQQRTKGATEYIEGVHFYYKDMYNDGKGGLTDTPVDLTGVAQTPQKMTFWTKKGVITLGFKLRETPQTIAFRDWASDYILNKPTSAPMSATELFYQSVMALREQEAKMAQLKANQQADHKELAKVKHNINRLMTNENYMTIIAYANLKGYQAKSYNSAQLGKRAKKLSLELGLPMGKVIDPRFGAINTYALEVLELVFKDNKKVS